MDSHATATSGSSPSEQALPRTAGAEAKTGRRPAIGAPALILSAISLAVMLLTLWYLLLPQPLVVQGEVDATRIDIAARVDGHIASLRVERGENIATGAVLLTIDNPELLARLEEAKQAKQVALAQLANINAGTRAEEIAVRKATVDSAAASVALDQQTYGRISQLATHDFATKQRLDEVTAALTVGQRQLDQARLALSEAQTGYTAEEHKIAEANVGQAEASVATLQASVDQMTVYAPRPAQIYQINTEQGEYVAPGVPLLAMVDLKDLWLRFDLREDLVKDLKVGDRISVRIPALHDRIVTAEIKVIAAQGEYAGWRATRATGDFDLRTFEIRAYPVAAIPELRPGMSVYADWRQARQ